MNTNVNQVMNLYEAFARKDINAILVHDKNHNNLTINAIC